MMKNRTLAEESIKTKKTREKLKKWFLEIDKHNTLQARKKKSREIHCWIACHVSDRVILPSASISLFDENRNSAKPSSKIAKTKSKSYILNKLRESPF